MSRKKLLHAAAVARAQPWHHTLVALQSCALMCPAAASCPA
jgi:hypothetical protein